MSNAYQRVVLKISGESFSKAGTLGIGSDELTHIATEIADAHRLGVQIAVVCGGGNIIRGATLAKDGTIDQSTADYMGMMGTVINGVALKEALERQGIQARAMSAINLTAVAEPFIRLRAIRHLEKNRVVILVAGTGNPFFTTDTCASLRSIELGADILLKATKVDGIYDKDPVKHDDAVRYDRVSYDEVLQKNLKVMDASAIALARDNNLPIIVFSLDEPGGFRGILAGQGTSTTVHG